MRTYELVVIVKPSISESDRKEFVDQIKKWLGNVKVTKEEDLGSKALAYKIGQDLTGHYFDLHIEGEKLESDLEKKLLESENVLRHLLIRTK